MVENVQIEPQAPKQKAVYIFASATSAKYRKNVLNVLLLPGDLAAHVRYKLKGPRVNLPADIEGQLAQNPQAPVYFVFVDRFAEHGYEYWPIRTGLILRTEAHGESLSVFFKVGEYCFPVDGNHIQAAFKALTGIPKAKNDRTDPDDGFYIVVDDNVFTETELQKGPEAFDRAADELSRKQAFTDAGDVVVFVRLELKGQGWQIEAETSGSNPQVRANRGNNVELECNVRIPQYASMFSGADGRIFVQTNGALKFGAAESLPLDGPHAFVALKARVLENTEGYEDGLFLGGATASRGQSSLAVCYPDQTIPIRIDITLWRRACQYGSVVTYIVGQYLVSAGGFYVPYGPMQLHLKHDALQSVGKGLGAILVAAGLIGMLRSFGKKLV